MDWTKAQSRYSNIHFYLSKFKQDDYNNLLGCELFKYIVLSINTNKHGKDYIEGYGEFDRQIPIDQIISINNRLVFYRRDLTQSVMIAKIKSGNTYQERGTRHVHRNVKHRSRVIMPSSMDFMDDNTVDYNNFNTDGVDIPSYVSTSKTYRDRPC